MIECVYTMRRIISKGKHDFVFDFIAILLLFLEFALRTMLMKPFIFNNKLYIDDNHHDDIIWLRRVDVN